MLPHEAEVIAGIAAKYRVQLDSMNGLQDAVVSMMTAGQWTIRRRRGVDPFVVQTMMGLLTKACKTFRAIQIHGSEMNAHVSRRVIQNRRKTGHTIALRGRALRFARPRPSRESPAARSR